jgi:hypothetical protein
MPEAIDNVLRWYKSPSAAVYIAKGDIHLVNLVFIVVVEATFAVIVALACLCVLAIAGMFEVQQSRQGALVPVTSGHGTERRTSWEID